MESIATNGLTAAAIVSAKRVVTSDELPEACLCCRSVRPLEVIVVQKPPTIGRIDAPAALLMAGVCHVCAEATSEERRAEISQLATAAARVDALLSLIRYRADGLLTPWWGGVGACSANDVDQASVELRRALERLGVKP
jgi:hypothetical protein